MTKITAQLPHRIDCTHPGCTECAAQIRDGKLLFRARHNGEKHQVVIDLREMLLHLTGEEKIFPEILESGIVSV